MSFGSPTFGSPLSSCRESTAKPRSSNSYIKNVSRNGVRQQKESRKTDVKDSLMKFLDDCGEEDLLMDIAQRTTKTNTSLSRSEHGPPRRSSSSLLSSGDNSQQAKRRGTKKDHIARANPRKSQSSALNRARSLGRSEHGTHATEKRSKSSLHVHVGKALEDDISISSSEGSFAAVQGEIGLGEGFQRRSSSSRSEKANRKSSDRSRSRSKSQSRNLKGRSTSQSSRSTKSKQRSSSKRSSRDTTKDVRGRKERNTKKSGAGSLQRSKSATMDHRAGSLGSTLQDIGRRSDSHRRSSMDDDNRSVSSSMSNFSSMTSRTGKSIGLDAGPLNAFLIAEEQRGVNSFSGSASVGPGMTPYEGMSDRMKEDFLSLRKQRQDQILNDAKKDQLSKVSSANTYDDKANDPDTVPETSDQSIDNDTKGAKLSAFSKFKLGLSKTKKVTTSTAKGTVNAVRDPKRTAKKVGGFAKDVGKETGKMLLDPKLAAKTAVSLGKDVTKGTFKVTRGVGKGVAKAGLGATTMVVGTALDGAGKVVTGATGLIFKHNGQVEDEYVDYDAAKMEDRRRTRTSLLERMSESDQPSTQDQSKKPSTRIKNHLPSLTVGKGNTWDF